MQHLGLPLDLGKGCHKLAWVHASQSRDAHSNSTQKKPLPRCGELLGLSQLLVTPSLSTHQWVWIRFSLSAGGKEMEIGRQGLHLNNASVLKEWSHGWEVSGFRCTGSEVGFLVSICATLRIYWTCWYLIIKCLMSGNSGRAVVFCSVLDPRGLCTAIFLFSSSSSRSLFVLCSFLN